MENSHPNNSLAWLDFVNFSRIYWLAFVLGLGWMIFVAANSPDAAFQDEVEHVNLARAAWDRPELILDLWGRPFNTIIYMLPARVSLGAARWLSVVMAACTVLLTTKIAQKFSLKRLWLIPLCLWFQPWFAEWYYTANTMIPFSLLLVLGNFLWLNKKWTWASLVFGLLPLTRHEGIALTGIWTVYLIIFHRKWKAAVISTLPLVGYNFLYLATFQRIASSNFASLQPTTFYGSGSWLHYLPAVLFGVYPGLLLLATFSIKRIMRLRAERLVFVPYIVYLATHIVIYRFGLFASGGYGFFLVPLAPAFALAGAIGAERVIESSYRQYYRRGNQRQHKILVGSIVFLITITGLLLTPRYPYGREAQAAQSASTWLKENGFSDFPTVTSHAWFKYFHAPYVASASAPSVEKLPASTIVVWDAHYSERRSINLSDLSDKGWIRLSDFEDEFIIIFQRR